MFTLPEEIPANTPVIVLDVPHCSIREYARRTGKTEAWVRGKITGPNPSLPIEKIGGTVLINLMKLAEQALNRDY